MKINKNEMKELRYLFNGGTVVDWPERATLPKKGLITVKSCFSNANHNKVHCDLTELGKEALLTDIYQEDTMWV